MRARAASPILILIALTGCSEDSVQRVVDASAPNVPLDAGTPSSPLDAGTPVEEADAGTSVPDAGAGADSGVEADAGGPGGVPACRIDLSSHLGTLGVAGLSAGIVKDGRLVCTAVAGQADPATATPVVPETLFAWASVSKTVTAAALMILHEQGRFQLDDDINDYLPFAVRNPDCRNTPITFRQLLTHSSSIIDADVYFETYENSPGPMPLGSFMQGYLVPGGTYYDASENWDEDCPGEWFEYSNVAIALGGYLVESISGTSLDEFCDQHLYRPLGMSESSFSLDGLDVNHIAVPYQGAQRIGHLDVPFPDGAGSFRTSVPQLARFLAMVMDDGVYEGQRILQAATVREMLRRQVPGLDGNQGLVWFYQAFGSHAGLVGHDGSDPGAGALMFFDPAARTGVLLVANGDWFEAEATEAAGNALFSLLLDEAATY